MSEKIVCAHCEHVDYAYPTYEPVCSNLENFLKRNKRTRKCSLLNVDNTCKFFKFKDTTIHSFGLTFVRLEDHSLERVKK